MNDDELKKILGNIDIPEPSESAQENAVNKAMQAFAKHAQEKQKNFKGSSKDARPTSGAASALEHLFGRLSMKKSYAFAGSLASVLLVLALSTTYHSSLQNIPVQPVANGGSPASVDEAKDKALWKQFSMKEEEPAKAPQRHKEMVTAEMDARDVKTKPQSELSISPGSLPAPANSAADTSAVAAAASTTPTPPALSLLNAAPNNMPAREAKKSAVMQSFAAGRADSIAPMEAKPMMDNYGQIDTSVQYQGNDKFEHFAENPIKQVAEAPVSTFSIDADTASYSFVRRALNGGTLPPADSVRVEEMVNYFDYNYPLPENRETPFKPTVAVYPTPWNKETKLVHIGIKGYDIEKAEKPRSNLVFLIDVSGSMSPQDRLPLVKNSLRMLVDQLQPDDTVGIVVYAGSVGTVLEPTKISDKNKILEALGHLEAGGSTSGGQGIVAAYNLAQSHFDKNAVNRVILATDGDFNVGVTDPAQLQTLIEHERDSGIFLSILGVGQGNYNDALMQKLAQHGNGTAAYVDNLNEARKLLVEEANSTLFTIAKDVKIQVEFNPEQVAEYRLVGYESRMLNREDFNNDKIDAGEVGAGHAVTAIYEFTPVGAKPQADALRYGKEPEAAKAKPAKGAFGSEYAFLKMRYKLPKESESKLITTSISSAQEVKDTSALPDDIRFASAVAAFGEILKGDAHIGSFNLDQVLALADTARGKDSFGYRAEFLNLVRLAKSLQAGQPPIYQPQPQPDVMRYDQ